MNDKKPNNAMNNMKPKNAKRMLGLALAAAMLPMAAMAEEAPAIEAATAAATAEVAATPAAESEASSGSTSGDKWSWAVTPYLWATSISSDIRKDGAPPVGSDVDFDDILSKLDMAFQIHVEGQGDRFGAFADFTYIALSDSNERPAFTSDASLDTTIFEAAAVWNVEPTRFEGVDVFAGVRHLQVGTDVELDPVDPTKSNINLKMDQSFTDFMVGARYNATLSDRWGLTLRADGGWGDTESDYSVSALLRYQLKKGTMVFGYRYMEIGVRGDAQKVDMAMQGPIIAFTKRF
ncbi:MAG TPA: hypothetical protein VN205_10400 [Thermomonas sp.]|nr:hypothetical protein [Thermomonas sp.]